MSKHKYSAEISVGRGLSDSDWMFYHSLMSTCLWFPFLCTINNLSKQYSQPSHHLQVEMLSVPSKFFILHLVFLPTAVFCTTLVMQSMCPRQLSVGLSEM